MRVDPIFSGRPVASPNPPNLASYGHPQKPKAGSARATAHSETGRSASEDSPGSGCVARKTCVNFWNRLRSQRAEGGGELIGCGRADLYGCASPGSAGMNGLRPYNSADGQLSSIAGKGPVNLSVGSIGPPL